MVSFIAALGAVLGALGTGMGMASMIDPVRRNMMYWMNAQWPNLLPEAADYINARIRGLISHTEYLNRMKDLGYARDKAELLLKLTQAFPSVTQLAEARLRKFISDSEYKSYMAKLGFKDKEANIVLQISKPMFAADTLIRMLWRGIINRSTFYSEMEKLGWSRDQADKLEKIAQYYPSPADIVRFAVREVYSPEIVRKYGLDQDMPSEYLEMAKKAGLSEEFAKQYWMAHWELPSITDGFEMFWRGIITREELETLLRTRDVMPYWRDKLIKLSYRPFTRVDARRMAQAGILSYSELVRSFMDIGYDREKAEKMATWTLMSQGEEERQLTKSQILELYRIGEFSRDEALKMLENIGYARPTAEYILKIQDHEREWDQIKMKLDALEDLYAYGIISRDQYFDELNKLNLASKTIDYIMLKADIRRMRNISLPTRADLIRWLKKGYIDEAQFYELMSKLGYPKQFIDIYLKEAKES